MTTAIHGEGTLYKRPRFRYEDGTKIPDGHFWQAAKDVPQELLPEGVSRKRITGSGDSKREALKKLDHNYVRYLQQAQNGEPRAVKKDTNPNASITLREWMEEWFRDYRGHLGRETYARQLGHARLHILDELGDYTLGELRSKPHFETWIKNLRAKRKIKNGIITDEPLLGDSAINNIYKTLHNALEVAKQKLGIHNFLAKNLVGLSEPGQVENDDEVYEAAEHVQRLFSELLPIDDPRYDHFYLSLLGLRLGERLGLTTDSVIGLNTARPKLRIKTQLQYAREYGTYLKQETKNHKIRDIPLREKALECVRRIVARREENSKLPSWKPQPGFEKVLLLRPDGSLVKRSQDTDMWRELLDEFNIPYFRHHLVRHVAGTRFLEQGMDQETLGAIMGHHSATMSRHYARQGEERSFREMDGIEFP